MDLNVDHLYKLTTFCFEFVLTQTHTIHRAIEKTQKTENMGSTFGAPAEVVAREQCNQTLERSEKKNGRTSFKKKKNRANNSRRRSKS